MIECFLSTYLRTSSNMSASLGGVRLHVVTRDSCDEHMNTRVMLVDKDYHLLVVGSSTLGMAVRSSGTHCKMKRNQVFCNDHDVIRGIVRMLSRNTILYTR